jgi:hypothetical protein
MDDEASALIADSSDFFFSGDFAESMRLLDSLNFGSDTVFGQKESMKARNYLCMATSVDRTFMEKIKGMQHSDLAALRSTALMAVFMKTNQEAQRKTALERLIKSAEEAHDHVSLYFALAAGTALTCSRVFAVDAQQFAF